LKPEKFQKELRAPIKTRAREPPKPLNALLEP
jgi:hypothetical protein